MNSLFLFVFICLFGSVIRTIMNDVAKATARAEDVCGEQLEPLETLRLRLEIEPSLT